MKEKTNTNDVGILPDVNRRVHELVLEKTSGNATAFARAISSVILNKSTDEKAISQQSLDRLFKIDGRSGKYPEVSSKILDAIVETYNVSKKWLIFGELPKYTDLHEQNSSELIEQIKNKPVEEQMAMLLSEILDLKSTVNILKERDKLYFESITSKLGIGNPEVLHDIDHPKPKKSNSN